MSQPAFKVDVLQIEPGSGQTLTVSRDSATGSLLFKDTLVPSGVTLQALSGLRNIRGVYIVGKAGSGAAYTTIQSAIDAVNGVTSTARNPALILIGPGVYSENITISKDGLCLVGLGGVILESATEATPDTSPSHTLTINNAAGTPPKQVILQNLTITNSHQMYACVRIAGSTSSQIGLVDTTETLGVPALTYGHGGIWIQNSHLIARGVGGYSVWATAINNLYIQNSTFANETATASFYADQCHYVSLENISEISGITVNYNSGGTIPAKTGSLYQVSNCPGILQLIATLQGAGSLVIQRSSLTLCTVNGNRTLQASQSALGTLTLNDTTSAQMFYSTRGSAIGTGTLAEPLIADSLTYAGAASASYVFGVANPEALFQVSVELPSAPVGNAYPVVENKTASGFDITFRDSAGTAIAQTMVVPFIVQRQV